MTLQNRVLPTGEIVATPARGTLTGNRGALGFDAEGRLGTSRWRNTRWITCALEHPKGRYHGPAPARGWTPLFFLDEAVALAAGHRPCAYCRRAAYDQFKSAWRAGLATEMDRVLHRARTTRTRQQIRHSGPCEDLPDWTFVLIDDAPFLVHGGYLRRFTPAGYTDRIRRVKGEVTVLTPAPTVQALAQGYAPLLHESLFS